VRHDHIVISDKHETDHTVAVVAHEAAISFTHVGVLTNNILIDASGYLVFEFLTAPSNSKLCTALRQI